jgi:endonuclease/exonuclease/phosphatase (EEP) superfamily protein YafD
VEYIFYIFGAGLILATAMPLIKADAWWIRVFDFPRLQILILAAATSIVFLLLVGLIDKVAIVFVVLLGLCVVFQFYMMFPYTRLSRVQVEDHKRTDPENFLSVLFANVLMDNRESAGLKEQIEQLDPDVILLAETDNWWQLEMDYLEKQRPHTLKYPQDNTYGLLLYSRFELIDAEINFLIQSDIPSFHGRLRLRSGRLVEFRCLHPRPPVPAEDSRSTPRDAEILIVGRENRDNSLPFVVFGDLNDVAWSRTNYLFQNVTGLLDPRIGRGFYHTFHAGIPLFRFPLDHLFHSNHFRLVDFRRLEYFGSDHFPVYIKLSLETDAITTQEELTPTEEELAEAEEKMAFVHEPPDVREADPVVIPGFGDDAAVDSSHT